VFRPLCQNSERLRGLFLVATCSQVSRSYVAIYETAVTTMQCSHLANSALRISAFDLHALLLGLLVVAPTLHRPTPSSSRVLAHRQLSSTFGFLRALPCYDRQVADQAKAAFSTQ
jgi:hypothetical protein